MTRGIGRTDRVDPVAPMLGAAAEAYNRPGMTAHDFATLADRYEDQQGNWALRAIAEFETIN